MSQRVAQQKIVINPKITSSTVTPGIPVRQVDQGAASSVAAAVSAVETHVNCAKTMVGMAETWYRRPKRLNVEIGRASCRERVFRAV